MSAPVRIVGGPRDRLEVDDDDFLISRSMEDRANTLLNFKPSDEQADVPRHQPAADVVVDVDTVVPLRHGWCFWHDRYVPGQTAQQYQDSLQRLCVFSTVQVKEPPFFSVFFCVFVCVCLSLPT